MCISCSSEIAVQFSNVAKGFVLQVAVKFEAVAFVGVYAKLQGRATL
jgi:hypothetical protein